MPPLLEEPKSGSFPCFDCSVDTLALHEYYMVHAELWESVVQDDEVAFLCVGCLEVRIGRRLVPTDFTEVPINYLTNKSDRLMERLGRWFREFDGPHDDPEEFNAAVEEMGRRFSGKVYRPGRLS